MLRCLKTVCFAAPAVLLCLASSLVHSMPANPEPRTFVQPDGSSFQASPKGDEHILWYETVDTGDIVVFNPLSSSYEYAEIETSLEGLFLRPSGLLFGQAPLESIPLVQYDDLMEAWNTAWEDFGGLHLHADEISANEAAPEDINGNDSLLGPDAGPLSGEHIYNTLFIMVEFNDIQFSSNEAIWTDKIFGGYPNNVSAGSLNDYYQEISQGQLAFNPANESQGTISDGFIKVKLDIDHPQYARNWSGWRTVLADAFNAAAPSIDFSQYDTNQSGVIDKTELLVSFIVSGRESSYNGSETEGFWGHAYMSYNFGNFNGVEISTGYMGFGERQGPTNNPYDSTIGIIAHELGHSAFNLRDLYNQPSAISYWGLMGTGSWGYTSGERLGARPVHMTAFSKMNVRLPGGKLGFFDAQEITPNGASQLITTTHPFGVDPYNFVKIPGEINGRYWLVEQRKVEGYDEGLMRNGNGTDGLSVGDTGILVSYLQYSSRLWIRRMNGQTSGTSKTDWLYAGNVSSFTPESSPINSNYPDSDVFSGLIIEQVSAPADQMTAYVRRSAFPCTSVTDTSVNHKSAGRAYSVEEGTWWVVNHYYANGSNDDLGTSTWSQITLNETSPGYFTTDACPIGDTTPPTITLSGNNDITVYQDNTWTEPGYSAIDDSDGDISSNVIISGSVNTAILGNYTLRYNVSDAAGNAASEAVRTVHVVEQPIDTTPPTITLFGEVNTVITIDTVFIEPGYSADDNFDGNITSRVIVIGSVDSSVIGETTLQYEVSDNAGNKTIVIRSVFVVEEPVDTTPPAISLSGNSSMTLVVGDAYLEPGYSATDDVDGDISAQVMITGSVNTNIAGNYTLRYNVSDAAGNAAPEIIRTVIVEEASPCVEHSASVNAHINAGRAYICGTYSYNGCAVGSGNNIGFTFLVTAVTVKEESPGYFDLGSCN